MPIAYASMQLKIHEKNYPLYDLGLATMIFALNIWIHHFKVRHLRFPLIIRALNTFNPKRFEYEAKKMGRVLEGLLLHYWLSSGKANMVVDALSKKHDGFVAKLLAHKWNLLEDFSKLNLEVQRQLLMDS